jgi:hypothetical protein
MQVRTLPAPLGSSFPSSHGRGQSDSASARRVHLVRFCTQPAGIEVLQRLALSGDSAVPLRPNELQGHLFSSVAPDEAGLPRRQAARSR